MTIEQAMEFISGVSWLGSRPGLERVQQLLSLLGNPQDTLRYVHVAGTNGKGSTAAMLASVLRAAGYRTGLYISPFIERFNERMQVNGAPITDAELAAVCDRLRPCVAAMPDPPTEFELVTAAAFLWFADQQCDIVVLEVGLGGRLDATNVIRAPECAVIANIGLDHTAVLGDTVAQIAFEKAGIIKSGTRAVSYQQAPEAATVLRDACRERGVPLTEADFSAIEPLTDSVDGQTFRYRGGAALSLPLLGAHQRKNAAVALEAVCALRNAGWAIPDGAVCEGLRTVSWPARFEILQRAPWFVLDGGHNPQCAETVAANLERYFPQNRKILLVGLLADKDYTAMTDILAPQAAAFVAVTPESERALPADALAAHLQRYGKPVTACAAVPDGVETALSMAGADGVVCATGSLYMAGEIRRCFRKE